jgi:integrase/recombinase XerD
MKLSDAVDHYLTNGGNLTTEPSREAMRKIGRQLADYCGDRTLEQYSTDELTGFCLGHGGRGTAPATIGSRKALLTSFFGWCAWQRIIPASPAVDLKHTVKVRARGVREHHWLTKRDVSGIAAGLNLEDPRQHRDYVVFRTTVMLGLRRSEVASLSWSSFRDDLSTVSVLRKGPKLVTKSVPAALRGELERWHRSQPAGAVLFPRFRWRCDTYGKPRLTPEWDRPIGHDGVYAIVREVAGVATHDLRRSFAGILEAEGVALRDVQMMMDHEYLSTTDRYLERNPARQAVVVEQVQW